MAPTAPGGAGRDWPTAGPVALAGAEALLWLAAAAAAAACSTLRLAAPGASSRPGSSAAASRAALRLVEPCAIGWMCQVA
jgi:hypothetical protein